MVCLLLQQVLSLLVAWIEAGVDVAQLDALRQQLRENPLLDQKRNHLNQITQSKIILNVVFIRHHAQKKLKGRNFIVDVHLLLQLVLDQ